MILYIAFPTGYDLAGATVEVDVDGISQTITELSPGDLVKYVRIADAVAAGSDVEVTFNNVVNPDEEGIYDIDFLQTADAGGNEIDSPTLPQQITITEASDDQEDSSEPGNGNSTTQIDDEDNQDNSAASLADTGTNRTNILISSIALLTLSVVLHIANRRLGYTAENNTSIPRLNY